MRHTLANSLLLLIAVGYTIGLLVVSLIQIESEELPVNFPFADKLFHFGVYFLLTCLWHLFYFNKKNKKKYLPNLWICGAAVAFGIIVELLQKYTTTYRGFEWLDIVANTSGVGFSFGFLMLFNYFSVRLNRFK